MATVVFEWYGFRPGDRSDEAAEVAATNTCPFVGGQCWKKTGVCTLSPAGATAPVVVCPTRLYGGNHRFLREIAADAFYGLQVEIGPDGLPETTSAVIAKRRALDRGIAQVGVFGKGFGSEIKLPAAESGLGSYSVDFTLVVITPSGELVAFAAIEVQTIDTTGSTKISTAALADARQVVPSSAGFNWENVSKRILPQLIVKGLMLQGERLCRSGLYFVAPEPVIARILARLGGERRLRAIPKQPSSITFVGYKHDGPLMDGLPLDMRPGWTKTISTSDMSIAFITPENLPPAGAYEKKMLKVLKS